MPELALHYENDSFLVVADEDGQGYTKFSSFEYFRYSSDED